MKIRVLPFEQPAGSFLIGVMNAADIIRISNVSERQYDPSVKDTGGGLERALSKPRVMEIAKYAGTMDAAFPTPILLALAPNAYSTSEDDTSIDLPPGSKADVVDGQHRLRGLETSGIAERFSLPVVFIVDATEEQKALLFATINGKQTKVPASHIYDLFGVTAQRSPEKTSHEVARAMNQTPESAWHGRLKMLGRKSPGGEETLSQGTFVKELLPLISPDPMGDRDAILRGKKPAEYPECVLNEYFVKDKDQVILRILMNAFGAVRETWPQEWKSPAESILTKSVGFTGIMRAMPKVIDHGKKAKDLSQGFFGAIFQRAKARLAAKEIALTSAHFSTSAGAGKLRDEIAASIVEQ